MSLYSIAAFVNMTVSQGCCEFYFNLGLVYLRRPTNLWQSLTVADKPSSLKPPHGRGAGLPWCHRNATDLPANSLNQVGAWVLAFPAGFENLIVVGILL